MPLNAAARLAQDLRAAFDPDLWPPGAPTVLSTGPSTVAVAVSGGGDSVALLTLMADWARDCGPAVAAVTVDHGLRAEAAAEASGVARLCADLGVPHRTLRWQDHARRGNLMAAARQARLRLIGDWARAQGIAVVALGHTADDQAETMLMRLARGSGVDGLAGMARWRMAEGVAWVRPLLGAGRADLRALLAARGIAWVEDPTNEDDRFDRARARKALAVLAPLGITRDRLVETAALMALAREALEAGAARAAQACVRPEAGEVLFDRARLVAEPREIRLRLLAHAVRWIGGGAYRPRLAALTGVETAVLAGQRRTLAGCLLSPRRGIIAVGREPRAALTARAEPGEVWDGRFVLVPPAGTTTGLEVRALGTAGLSLCPGWRTTGQARAVLLASPAVWRGDDLVAAPLAGCANGWAARPARDPEQFFSSILSH